MSCAPYLLGTIAAGRCLLSPIAGSGFLLNCPVAACTASRSPVGSCALLTVLSGALLTIGARLCLLSAVPYGCGRLRGTYPWYCGSCAVAGLLTVAASGSYLV